MNDVFVERNGTLTNVYEIDTKAQRLVARTVSGDNRSSIKQVTFLILFSPTSVLTCVNVAQTLTFCTTVLVYGVSADRISENGVGRLCSVSVVRFLSGVMFEHHWLIGVSRHPKRCRRRQRRGERRFGDGELHCARRRQHDGPHSVFVGARHESGRELKVLSTARRLSQRRRHLSRHVDEPRGTVHVFADGLYVIGAASDRRCRRRRNEGRRVAASGAREQYWRRSGERWLAGDSGRPDGHAAISTHCAERRRQSSAHVVNRAARCGVASLLQLQGRAFDRIPDAQSVSHGVHTTQCRNEIYAWITYFLFVQTNTVSALQSLWMSIDSRMQY